MSFDHVMMVDWSARATPSPVKPTRDAIFAALDSGQGPKVSYFRTRAAVMQWVTERCTQVLAAGQRMLMGFDFAFGYPSGFAAGVCGRASALALWQDLSRRVRDGDDNANNRFDVARALNRLFPGVGPLWGCPAGQADADLPAKGLLRHGHGLPERRAVERTVGGAQPVWKLFTTGSVGSQTLLGIARLQHLRARFGPAMAVWPFETGWSAGSAPLVLAEVYPSLICRAAQADIPDEVQVRRLCEWVRGTAQAGRLEQLFARPADLSDDRAVLREEGWILGAGHPDLLPQHMRSA